MRLLFLNIRPRAFFCHAPVIPVAGDWRLRSSRQILERITDFIRERDQDVVGLLEVDTGSIRSGMVNQAEFIASHLAHYSTYQCKYGEDSLNQFMPIVRKQANAFLAAPRSRADSVH